MIRDDDANDDALAAVDLHAWAVPPPLAAEHPAILARALAPARPPQRRIAWMVVALAISNAALALVLVIVLSSRPEPSGSLATVTMAPAGGGAIDPQVQQLLEHIDSTRRELEQKLGEVLELRTVVNQLAERVHACEQPVTVRKPEPTPEPARDHEVPAPVAPVAPVAPGPTSCDEVSCVLGVSAGACCAKFKTASSTVPETLDRDMISRGIAQIKSRVMACGDTHGDTATKVKVRFDVAGDGHVLGVTVAGASDAGLRECVERAARQATFAKTQQGGKFSYPFGFGNL